MCAERSLPLITLPDADQVEHILQVKDREDATTLDTIEQVIKEWQGVAIFLGDRVETPVVDTETKLP